MSEPTLSLPKSKLQAAIGQFLGYGRGVSYGETAWTTDQQNTITDLTNSGYRQFLYPSVGGDAKQTYDWSFLKPTGSFVLASGASVIQLPDDFGGFDGQITVLTNNVNSWPWRIDWRNEGMIREMFMVTPTFSGPPMYAAESVLRGTGSTQGQRYQLLVYPQADQNYTLQAPYFLNPDALSDGFPYCLGGPQHTETCLAAVIAAAELFLDDDRGPRWQYFQERLEASIAADRKNKPQVLGYNRDCSDASDVFWRGPVHGWGPPTTYNGNSVQP
jgi:hypothetical protein